MANYVFRTRPDDGRAHEVVGVGVLPPNGKGGITLEKAAPLMSELAQRDESGQATPDEYGRYTPLTGQKLREAAQKWAEARGFVVEQVSDKDLEQSLLEAGQLPELGPESALAAAMRDHQSAPAEDAGADSEGEAS